jgi:UDP-N-acetylglucosamine 2-epimerase (non-hydrolysing)
MSGLKRDRVLDAVRVITNQFSESTKPILAVSDYSNCRVSQQVVRIVLSYVDYINRVVWAKPDYV